MSEKRPSNGNLISSNTSVRNSINATPRVSDKDAKFNQWLQNKSIRDRSIELLGKISPTRSEVDESLKEVAIALLAVDEFMKLSNAKYSNEDNMSKEQSMKSTSESRSKAEDDNVKKPEDDKGVKTLKPLRNYWLRWAMESHTLNNVVIFDDELKQLSGAVKEYIEVVDGKHKLASMKYFFPSVPKNKSDKAKPLTNDQKVQNSIYLRMMYGKWNACKVELRQRIAEYVARKEEALQKMKHEDDPSKAKNKLIMHYLYDISLKQFNLWVEEDEDKKMEIENQEKQEKMFSAKQSHEYWVKKKDGLRIRIPESKDIDIKVKPISYGREYSGVRPLQQEPSDIALIKSMADSGFKYIHVNAKDLEKTKQALAELGHIYKENFDAETRHEFDDAVESNKFLNEKSNFDKKLREDSSKAYEDWLISKDFRDQAIKCLTYIAVPTPKTLDDVNGAASQDGFGSGFLRLSKDFQDLKSSRHKLTSSHTGSISSTVPAVPTGYTPEDYTFVIEVGKALKKVDRTLFQEWSNWCRSLIKPNHAVMLWDAFPPIACDVHTLAYSQLRDTFLKLLKPGLDYRKTFLEFAKSHRPRGRGRDRDDDDESKDESIALTKDQMRQLLRNMGMIMSDNELTVLIDSFDANHDERISLQEFLEFTGTVKRDKKSGVNLLMKRRCCWLTTCHTTGMANAFVVTTTHSDNQLTDSDTKVYPGVVCGFVELKKLRSGEKRIRIELKERRQRIEILKQYGILDAEFDDSTKPKKKNTQSKDVKSSHIKDKGAYDDDFEDEEAENYDNDGFDDENAQSKSGSPNSKSCDIVSWSVEKRAEGLQVLYDMTKVLRQEEALRQLLTNGKPPCMPKLWCEYLADDFVEEHDREYRSEEVLRLCWESPNSDLVSFYSLEFGGLAVTSANGSAAGSSSSATASQRYAEIYRDPPDARASVEGFNMNFLLDNLSPNTSYMFRIRAFNGYGSGDYCYRVFTSKPRQPTTPIVTKLSWDSVTVKWDILQPASIHITHLQQLFDAIVQFSDTEVIGSYSAAIEKKLWVSCLNYYLDLGEDKSFIPPPSVKDSSFGDKGGLRAYLRGVARLGGGVARLKDIEELFANCDGILDQGGLRVEKLTWKSINHFLIVWGSKTAYSAASAAAPMSFVIERCESDLDETYSPIIKTTLTEATISRLPPGQSFRYRIFALNGDGVASVKSNSVVVHTQLETPVAPALLSGPAFVSTTHHTPTSITLVWPTRQIPLANARGEVRLLHQQQILESWTGCPRNGDTDTAKNETVVPSDGVSIEKAYVKYDAIGKGRIEIKELGSLLSDLGIDVTEDRLQNSLAVLDTHEDHLIRFAEFSDWWHAATVDYVLLRSHPVPTSTLLPPDKVSIGNGGDHSNSLGEKRRSNSVSSLLASANAISGTGKLKRDPSNVTSTNGVAPGAVAVSVPGVNIATPIICFHGRQVRATVNQLTPNTLYHFRLRYLCARSQSNLSKPLIMMTRPLPPAKPIILTVTANQLKVKWYPVYQNDPDSIEPVCYGCYKFLLQYMMESQVGDKLSSKQWITCYAGQDNFYSLISLQSNTRYKLRVLAVNKLGDCSQPSPESTVTTLPRTQTTAVSSLSYLYPDADMAKILREFIIECSQDIVVGDVILFTERLYVKTMSTSSVIKSNKSVTGSVHDESSEEGKRYIGERCLVCHVIHDNYRMIRDIHLNQTKRLSSLQSQRSYQLEVFWSRTSFLPGQGPSSSNSVKVKDYRIGDIIERKQKEMQMYEIFRLPWKEENNRESIGMEWKLLNSCYVE